MYRWTTPLFDLFDHDRFGTGYTMIVKTSSPQLIEATKAFVAEKFQGAVLLEQHQVRK